MRTRCLLSLDRNVWPRTSGQSTGGSGGAVSEKGRQQTGPPGMPVVPISRASGYGMHLVGSGDPDRCREASSQGAKEVWGHRFPRSDRQPTY